MEIRLHSGHHRKHSNCVPLFMDYEKEKILVVSKAYPPFVPYAPILLHPPHSFCPLLFRQKNFPPLFTSADTKPIISRRIGKNAYRISSYISQRERRTMGRGPSEAPAPAFRRDDEVRGESKVSADAPPCWIRARTQPVNMRATAKQRGCDRGTRSNGCEFALLILKEEN